MDEFARSSIERQPLAFSSDEKVDVVRRIIVIVTLGTTAGAFVLPAQIASAIL